MFKENIGVDQVIKPGEIICFSAKWVDNPDIYFYSNWQHGHEGMLRAAHALLSECDAVVGINQKKFDIPHLRAEFRLHKLPPLPPLTQIDVQQWIKSNYRLLSNKLAFIGPYFRVGKKIENEGFLLWRKVLDGNLVAQAKMEKYCRGDVKLTEKIFKLVRPDMHNLPRISPTGKCRSCGGNHFHSRGYRYTATMRIQRLKCQNHSCGHWQDGKREKIT